MRILYIPKSKSKLLVLIIKLKSIRCSKLLCLPGWSTIFTEKNKKYIQSDEIKFSKSTGNRKIGILH